MKNREYWTYNQRFPAPRGKVGIKERVLRLLDHMDDILVAGVVELDFHRMHLACGPGHHSRGQSDRWKNRRHERSEASDFSLEPADSHKLHNTSQGIRICNEVQTRRYAIVIPEINDDRPHLLDF